MFPVSTFWLPAPSKPEKLLFSVLSSRAKEITVFCGCSDDDEDGDGGGGDYDDDGDDEKGG